MLQRNKRLRRLIARKMSQKAAKMSLKGWMNQALALMMIYSVLMTAVPARGLAAGNRHASNNENEQTTTRSQETENSRISETKEENRSTDDFAAEPAGQTATELENGDVLIIGGSSAKIYFAASDSFGATGALISPRENHAAVRLNDGRVLITGGSQDKAALRSTEIFDPSTGMFSAAAEMNFARSGHTATALTNGKVLIAGGGNAELYDPSSNTFETIGSQMKTARTNHTASLLNDGRILIVGGVDKKGKILNSAELFDSSINEFIAAGEMQNGRKNAVLRVLHDGKVQIIGGGEQPTMELFDPNSNSFGANAKIPANGDDFPELFENIMSSPTRAAVLGKGLIEIPQAKKALLYADANGLPNGQIFNSSKATISTEALNYPAGNTVVVTGKGFMPSEIVELVFYQTGNSTSKNQPRFTVQTNENGEFRFDGYTTEASNGSILIDAKGTISDEKGQTTVSNLSPGSLVNYPTSSLSGASVSVPPNLTNSDPYASYSNITRGPGVNPVSGAGAFNANQWSNSATLDTSLNDYFEFTINPCDKFSATQISIGLQRSPSGPRKAVLRSSVDSFASDLGGAITVNETATRTVINLSSIAGLQNTSNTVTFRIYGYDSSSGSGTMQIMGVSAPNSTVGIEVDGSASNVVPIVNTNPSDQTISFGNNASFTSTADSGLQQWQVSTNNGVSWIDMTGETSNTLTVISPGISQSGYQYRSRFSNDCGFVVSNAAALTINQASADVSLSNLSHTYDGTPKSATATTNPNGLNLDLSYVGTGMTDYPQTATPPTAAGTYEVTATINDPSYNGSDTQAFTIAKRTLNVTASAENKTYDGNTDAAVTLDDDRITNDDVEVSYTSASFADANVGTGKTVTVSGISISGGTDAGNYVLSNSSVTTGANITLLSITATVTVNSKIYDGNTSATIATRNLNGVLNGDDVTVSGGTAAFNDKNVENGKTVSVSGLTISGDDAENYSFSSAASATANITQRALTVTASGVDKQYDGTTIATVNLSDDRVTDDDLTVNYASANFDTASIGTGKIVSVSGITVSGDDAGNYSYNTEAETSADIETAQLTVTVTVSDKIYDRNNSATISSIELIGVAENDDVEVVGGTATFDDRNVGTDKPVTILGLTLTGAAAGNYSLNGAAVATANITPRSLTVSANASSRIYNGTTDASVTLSDNRVSGDAFDVQYTSASFDDKNVGEDKNVIVSDISISGDDAGNYSLTSITATALADITRKSLTATATAQNKAYDGNTSATVSVTSNDVVFGDTVTLGFVSATFDTADVGTNKPVSVSGISIDGADASNYSLQNEEAETTADITAIDSETHFTSTAPLSLRFNQTYEATAETTGDGVLTISAGPSNVCTISSLNLVTIVAGSGTCTVTATTADGTNYRGSSAAAQTINAAPAASTTSFTSNAPTSLQFGETYLPTADTSSDGTPIISASGSCSYSAGVVTIVSGSGTCTVSATTEATDNYESSSAEPQTINAQKAPSTTEFTSENPGTLQFGQTYQATAETVVGDGDLSIAVDTPSVCSIDSSNVVTINAGSGTCVVRATTAESSNYVGSSVTQSITAQKSAATLSFVTTTLSQSYTGQPRIVEVDTFVNGEPVELDEVLITYNGSPTAPTDAGSYPLSVSLDNDNYEAAAITGTLDITRAVTTIEIDDPGAKTYGDAPFSLSVTTDSGSSNPVELSSLTTDVCTVSGSTVTILSAGDCTVRAFKPGDSNYKNAVDELTISVAKKTLIVTIDDQTVNYGDNLTFTPSYDGFVNGDTVSVLSAPPNTPPTCSVSIILPSVGDHEITCSGGSNNNYGFDLTDTGTLTVNPAQASSSTITIVFVDSEPYVYRGTAFTATARVTGAGGLDEDITASIIYTGCTNAGTCHASATFSDDNHELVTGLADITIAKAQSSVSISGGNFIYNGVAHSATGSVTGIGDPAEDIGTPIFEYTPGSPTSADAPVNAGTYTVVGSFAGNGNYNPSTSAPATITIGKADQTITFAPIEDQYYGAPDFTVSPTASSGLPVTLSASSSPISGLCAVTGFTIRIVGAGTCTITASQNGNENYNPATNNNLQRSFTIATVGDPVTASVGNPAVRATLPSSGPVTVNVPVVVSDVTNHGFISFEFTVEYDNDVLTPVSSPVVVSEDDLADGFNPQANAVGNRIAVQGNRAVPMSGAGRLLSLQFTADAIGCTDVSFVLPPSNEPQQPIVFNTGTNPVTATSGRVCIAEDTTTTVSFGSGSFVYKGSPFTATATTTGNRTSDSLTPITITYGGDCTNVTTPNGCTATASYAATETRNASSATASITIEKAQLTVTANDKTRSYGVANPMLDAAITGFVGGESLETSGVTGAPECTTTATETSPVSGSPYAITCSIGTLVANNYNFTFVDGSLTIEKADQTINFDPLSDKLIGSADFDVSVDIDAPTSGGSINPVTFSASPSSICTISGSTVHLVFYGECTITASKLGDDNYNDAPDVSRSFNVIPYETDLNVSLPMSPASSYNGESFAVPVSISETGRHAINTITFDLLYGSIWNQSPTFITGTTCGGAISTTPISGGVLVTITALPSSYLSGSCSVVFNFVSNNTGSSSFEINDFVYSSDTPNPHTGGATVTGSPYSVTVSNGSISGTITNFHNGLVVPDVLLSAAGSPPVSSSTNSLGDYNLFGFGNGDYTVTPSKSAETRSSSTAYSAGGNNSILSNDVTMIQRHRVGLCPVELDGSGNCPRPWDAKMQAAADVDQNHFVQSFDASLIQQFRAGIPNVVNKTGFWLFTDESKTYENVWTPKTAEDYTALLLGDVDGSWNVPLPPENLIGGKSKRDAEKPFVTKYVKPQVADIAPMAVNVTLPTASLPTNVTISQDILVGNTTGQGVFSYDFDIVYNPTVVEPALSLVSKQDTLSANMSVVANVVTPGRLAVSASGINSLSGSGVLLKVIWRTIGNSGDSTPITFDPFIFNGGTPSATVVNGQITLSVVTAQQASISGRVTATDSKGLNGAIVTITGADGQSVSVRTNNFGVFTANGFPIGQTYIISVRAKGYTFAPQTLNLLHDEENLEITGQP